MSKLTRKDEIENRPKSFLYEIFLCKLTRKDEIEIYLCFIIDNIFLLEYNI